MPIRLSATDILIVDDNTPMRTLLKSYLTAFGATRLREAPNGQVALGLLQTRPADLTLLDHSMPGMSGVEFTRLVRASEEPRLMRMPIVMISGHGDARLVTEARDAGVDEFLIKPVTMNNLLLRLESALKSNRAFVESEAFKGPDRRRRAGRAPASGDRRASFDLD